MPFHAYRVFGAGQTAQRVAIDGCIYGPHAARFSAELRAMADSLQYTPTGGPSPTS